MDEEGRRIDGLGLPIDDGEAGRDETKTGDDIEVDESGRCGCGATVAVSCRSLPGMSVAASGAGDSVLVLEVSAIA